MEEVGWGVKAINNERRGRRDAIAFVSRTQAVTRAGVIPGVVGTIEEVLNDLVGSSDIELINVIKLGPEGSGEGRGGDSSGGERRRQH